VKFGAVKKFRIPNGRSPNAITVAPDGSVWFGEQALPGVGHLYPNGTLVEYQWPFQYASSPGFTIIWGIAVWDGCVWASDQAGSQIVAVDPESGRIRSIRLSEGTFPYTLTVGPDGSLWFTEIFGSKLARIDNQFNLHEYPLPVIGTPAQLVFANETLGYYVDAGNVAGEQGIYSFDPANFAPQIVSNSVTSLASPTSLTLTSTGVWVAQHASSDLAYYPFGSDTLVQFPTTPVNYVTTTLPYFVTANGSLVWFNEHYGNRIGVIDTMKGLLTEYSVSDPPASKRTEIGDALTLAVGTGRVWFTELSGNYVGYVDATYKPSFAVQTNSATIQLTPGAKTSVRLEIDGDSARNLTCVSSVSAPSSGPQSISVNASETQIGSLHGGVTIALTLAVGTAVPPGEYEVLVSVTDGLVTQGAYLSLTVS
jgi:virginiamycin B lyase